MVYTKPMGGGIKFYKYAKIEPYTAEKHGIWCTGIPKSVFIIRDIHGLEVYLNTFQISVVYPRFPGTNQSKRYQIN